MQDLFRRVTTVPKKMCVKTAGWYQTTRCIRDTLKAIREKQVRAQMRIIEVDCLCGAVKLQLEGEPIAQLYCHCDDCQAVHSAAYVGVAVFPSQAVKVVRGEPATWTHKTLPRQRCAICGTHLIARVPDTDVTAVKANLLPQGMFKPEFHIYCEYAVLPVKDDLPHYRSLPAAFGGSDEVVDW